MLLKFGVFASLISGAVCCFGGVGSGTTVTGFSPALATKQQNKIRELMDALADVCPTCEQELKRKIVQAQKCRALTCDFELGSLCNFKGFGRPGLPDDLLTQFLKDNPQFKHLLSKEAKEALPGDEEMDSDESFYAIQSGLEHEQLGPDAGRSPGADLGLTSEQYKLASAFLGQDTGDDAGSELLSTALGGRRRRKRQLSSLLGGGGGGLLGGGSSSGGLGDLFGGGSNSNNKQTQQQRLAKQQQQLLQQQIEAAKQKSASSQAQVTRLENLGLRVPQGARNAAQLGEELAEQGKVPGAVAEIPSDSDITWGVFNKQFGGKKNGIEKAAGGSYFATTWAKPGERAILQGTTVFGTDMYLFYDIYEATEDIQLRMCCDTMTRCTVSTPLEEGGKATKEWRKLSGMCPKGTRKVLFVCENRGIQEGACGLDNVKLFNPDGIDMCENIDLLAGTDPGLTPESVREAAKGATGIQTAEQQAQAIELSRLLAQLKGDQAVTAPSILGNSGGSSSSGGAGGLSDLLGKKRRK